MISWNTKMISTERFTSIQSIIYYIHLFHEQILHSALTIVDGTIHNYSGETSSTYSTYDPSKNMNMISTKTRVKTHCIRHLILVNQFCQLLAG